MDLPKTQEHRESPAFLKRTLSRVPDPVSALLAHPGQDRTCSHHGNPTASGSSGVGHKCGCTSASSPLASPSEPLIPFSLTPLLVCPGCRPLPALTAFILPEIQDLHFSESGSRFDLQILGTRSKKMRPANSSGR